MAARLPKVTGRRARLGKWPAYKRMGRNADKHTTNHCTATHSETLHGKTHNETLHGKTHNEALHGKTHNEALHGKTHNEALHGKTHNEALHCKTHNEALQRTLIRKHCEATSRSRLRPSIHY